MSELAGRIAFIQEAERLKNVLRRAYTSNGRQESTAEHSWRLCLMALTFADLLGEGVDVGRLLKLCIIHDLGEAIHGDVPATQQHQVPDKSARERRDLQQLTSSLPQALQDEFLALWDDYEQATSAEAQIVKALDKLETIIQHNQGANPPDFDYRFNLHYGRRYTEQLPLLAQLRALIDADTRCRAERVDVDVRWPTAQPCHLS